MADVKIKDMSWKDRQYAAITRLSKRKVGILATTIHTLKELTSFFLVSVLKQKHK